jgi:hypothetical protein
MFPIFIFTPQKLENSLEKEKEFLLLGPNSLCRPNPPHEAGPHRPTLSAPLPVGPGALTTPPINHPPSARAPPVRIFSPKSPSRVHWRSLVIHCCCAPSCRPGTCHRRPRANASCARHRGRLVPSRAELSPHTATLCASAAFCRCATNCAAPTARMHHLASLLASSSTVMPCMDACPFSSPRGHLVTSPLLAQHG